ncbi:MAG: nucleoside-diphosphate kinase [Bacteroidia bacterium]
MSYVERTLGLIKPDAIAAGHVGKILDRIIQTGFRIVALRMVYLTRAQAEAFYAVHRSRPFFEDLVQFMTSGPVIAFVLEKEDAVAHYRALMGATDPAQAAPGTLRALFGQNVERNAVHGSDSPESARREIAFFFSESELVPAQVPTPLSA